MSFPASSPPPALLAYGEGDFNGYWLLALLLITFINWVATQLKRRQALKRGEPFEIDPADFAPYLDRAERRASEEAPDPGAEPKQTRDEIRDFFAALTGQPPAPPKPKPGAVTPQPGSGAAPHTTSPPPVPKRARAASASSSAYQPAAASGNTYLSRIAAAKKREATAPSRRAGPTEAEKLAAASYQRQFGSQTKARSSRSRTRHDALVRLLKDPESLRTAFVLREVLGPPKGLQNDADSPTL